MAAVFSSAYLGIAVWTLVSFVAAVIVGRALRRLEPIPVRVRSPRVVDLRRPR
jgi:hypothetical protein